MELRSIALWLVCVAIGFASCTRVETVSPAPSVSLGGGGAPSSAGSGSQSQAGDGAGGDGGAYLGPGGKPGVLELGVWPTFARDPSQSGDVQAVLASVSALSLGAGTLPFAERWDQLSGATGSPRASTWSRLDAMSAPFRDRNAGLALCIDVVDRTQQAWPFAGELDSAAAAAAIERTVDEAYARFSPSLSHLCFGYEVDRYLGVASSAAQSRLLAFLAHAVDYARRHPLRTSRTSVGVALSLGALREGNAAQLSDLILGDEVVAVYDPLDASGALKPADSVSDEVAGALDTIAGRPGPRRPLTLFEVGYPSSKQAGSSEALQQRYYAALFDLLDARPAELGFVGVYGLADRAAADCAAEAPAWVGSSDVDLLQAWATARCSMGLRADSEKLASTDVTRALSRYR